MFFAADERLRSAMRYAGGNVGFTTLHANTVVERFLIPLVPAMKIALDTSMTVHRALAGLAAIDFATRQSRHLRADARVTSLSPARHHRCLKGTEK
ncbi:hypothetical protein [Mycobacterium paraintracellulare]|nr:hypothetical protein [Mycobacterium paraintracellulare]